MVVSIVLLYVLAFFIWRATLDPPAVQGASEDKTGA